MNPIMNMPRPGFLGAAPGASGAGGPEASQTLPPGSCPPGPQLAGSLAGTLIVPPHFPPGLPRPPFSGGGSCRTGSGMQPPTSQAPGGAGGVSPSAMLPGLTQAPGLGSMPPGAPPGPVGSSWGRQPGSWQTPSNTNTNFSTGPLINSNPASGLGSAPMTTMPPGGLSGNYPLRTTAAGSSTPPGPLSFGANAANGFG